MTAYNKLHNKQDMVGRVFNKWTVLEYSHQAAHSGNWFYLCQCTCGKQGTVQGTKLRNNKSSQCKSCTCKANGRKGIYAKNVGTDLYVIKCNDHYYKIGTTLNIEGRLKTIKSNNPYELTCVYYGKE